jgi:Fe-S cluster biogenesis protein NfuA
MTGADATQVVADRVDRLLAELRSAADPRAAAAAEELTCCLVQLYGAGLARIMAIIDPARRVDLCADPLVESLLLVHDLHPVDADTRVRQALHQAWPHPGELDYRGIDDSGVVHLRLTRAAGCRSARATAAQQIEAIIRQAAPEATGVTVDIAPPAPPLLQVSPRPGP